MSIAAGVFALFFSFFPFHVHAGRTYADSHGLGVRRPAEAYGGIIDRPRTLDAHGGITDAAGAHRYRTN